MTPKAHAIEISAICLFFILLALGGVVWDISSGLLASGIDGIMLLFVCAMMAGIFFLIMLLQLNKSGIIPTPKFLQAEAKPAAAAKAPASPAAGAAAKPVAPAAATPGAAPAKPTIAPSAAGGTPAPAKPAAPATSPVAPSTPPGVPEK